MRGPKIGGHPTRDSLLHLFCLEIDPEVDFDSRRAVYFRQMRYGLFVRPLRQLWNLF